MNKNHRGEAEICIHNKGVFAAANSGRGFVSFYEKIFSDSKILRRYLIKGGPGTGKSSFMRRVATAAEKDGFSVRYYYCSSDHTSLDAIVIENTIALLDATAPHTVDPELAGAKDEIINLGEFWDSERLFEKKVEIGALSRQKSESYAGAYRFLEGALALDIRAREMSSGLLKISKLEAAAKRAIEKIPQGEGYSCDVGIRRSIGMSGRARLMHYEISAKKLYAIEDHMETAHVFLSYLAKEAFFNQNAVTLSFNPLNTDCMDGILFEESGVAFVVLSSEEAEKYAYKLAGKINMRRFVKTSALSENEKKKRREYKSDVRIREGLITSAVDSLRDAGRAHFELEKIYGDCMDFDAESKFCQSFAITLCDNLRGLIK